MGVVEEKVNKSGGFVAGTHILLEEMKLLKEMQDHNTSKKAIHSELWHACAGPLVTLPEVGSLVYYFPQGHSEQVAVTTNRSTTYQIPNYPNLPSQLLCQVHNVTLHADKDTDEIFAQMSLQPVNSEKDVLPMPDFGLKHNKHPTEFFCKTLTASDTSTHGGFSVPRRAAEKLFPQLDYSMQPPTQELVVKDLHENTWTFRHIYRGQPKRHLLTTGWSMFVGSKRLRAGDSVLFIRDERSQLMVGVRRANRQQSSLPSSVLSADSMHLGVLAAAAHAAANRSSFSIFYNPRACPSEFVISLTKYRKSLYSTQISSGVRFGMMFETEDSTKRRYMGTVIGVNDLDPVRWPSSKWRNIQVEWDEPGSGDKQNRVSPWEIETPESLFIFPSLTTGLKRPFQSTFLGAQSEWENMVNKPYFRVPGNVNRCLVNRHSQPPSILQSTLNFEPEPISKLVNLIPVDPHPTEITGLEAVLQSSQYMNQNNDQLMMQMNPKMMQTQLDSRLVYQHNDTPQLEHLNANGLFMNSNNNEWNLIPTTCQSLDGFVRSNVSLSVLEKHENPNVFTGPEVDVTEEMWMNQLNYAKCSSQPNSLLPLPSHEPSNNAFELKDLPEENLDSSDIYSCLNFDGSNNSSTVVDPSVSSTTFDDFSTFKNVDFHNPSDFLSQGFSFQEFADNSGGTCSSNAIDLDESHAIPNNVWQQTGPRVRTYTKIQRAGSVGRSIDVSRFKNYEELCSAIECMFGLEGLLNDTRKDSGWKLVYVDYENDVLLVGDDPWEEFVGCVRCIRILSPSEVQQMGEEGMKLLNSISEAAAAVVAARDL